MQPLVNATKNVACKCEQVQKLDHHIPGYFKTNTHVCPAHLVSRTLKDVRYCRHI